MITLSESEYRRGDIIVFKDPVQEHNYMVKRVIGIGGDSVTVAGGALYLNGVFLSEPYAKEPMVYEVQPPFKVPDGRFFVLGDNRNNSEDSSFWLKTDNDSRTPSGERVEPAISKDAIIGKVRYIYLPLERTGTVKSFPLDDMLE